MEMVTRLDGLVAERIGRPTGTEGGVELGEIGTATHHRGKAGDRHEGEGKAGGPSRRTALTYVAGRERERRRDGGNVRRRAGLGRQLRDREAGAAAALAAARLERASHRADAFLQHDVAPAAVARSQQHRGPDRRWPANGSSRAGVKMRTRARCAGSAGANTNTVSGWLN